MRQLVFVVQLEPSLTVMLDFQEDPRVRNVIVFGESGVGKSSLINMVADMPTAGTSSDSVGCTLRYEAYLSTIEGETFNLWDTVGLDEGTFGTVPAAMAEGQLKTFLCRLTAANGIDLVVYCVRGTRARKALLHNYRILCSIINRRRVPVVLVVTGLENYEGKMEDWWARNEQELKHYGMCFDGHACVTTLNVKMVKDVILRDRCEESRRSVRDLIRRNRRSDSWIENAGLPTVVIYDPTVSVLRTQHRPGCSEISQNYPLPMNKRLHHFQPVSPLPHRQERSFKADLLVFYVEARSYDYRALIIVVKGLSNEESLDRWRKNYQQAEGTAVTFTYWPSPESGERCREEADQRFQQLVERHCCAKDSGLGEQTRRYFNLILAGAGAVVGVIQWEKFFRGTLGDRFLNIESLP
ncbi:hypothetical protein BV22DRAFT_1033417 [Leucogyrophana mollusca]|uniref:Uncharacterized protein n=1 Tax=Leucogyrophana mollusca TaxID=85980 RepID=A0ACB8BM21_9AGAM|nr:hypothetical protein BV22DRAFT_1033417 [Leucogyrophana mollusca]